jgi:hypothetical protein
LRFCDCITGKGSREVGEKKKSDLAIAIGQKKKYWFAKSTSWFKKGIEEVVGRILLHWDLVGEPVLQLAMAKRGLGAREGNRKTTKSASSPEHPEGLTNPPEIRAMSMQTFPTSWADQLVVFLVSKRRYKTFESSATQTYSKSPC